MARARLLIALYLGGAAALVPLSTPRRPVRASVALRATPGAEETG